MTDPEALQSSHACRLAGTTGAASGQTTALRWLVGLLALAGLAMLVPFWAPLLLAAWGAIIAWPLQQRLGKWSRRRTAVAGVLSTLLVLAILTPLVVSVLSLSASAVALGQKLIASRSGEDALRALSGEGGVGLDWQSSLQHIDLKHAFELVHQHGARALGVATSAFGMMTAIALGVVVFVAAFFSFLVEGRQLHRWLLGASPLSHAAFHRLANTFVEVGRGLLIGVGLTALTQGTVATIGYLVTGVPQAFVLGLLTMVASLIPSVGSGLVWAPVTAGLALSGRHGAALVMLAIGLFTSVVDNLLRPAFARHAALRLHGLVLFVSMLGGIVLLGAWGLLLGPLVVRMAVEGVDMLREQRAAITSARHGSTVPNREGANS